MKYFVYILQSVKDLSYYIGVTNNLPRRIKEHNHGLSKSTKSKRPLNLIYSEKMDDIKSAYKREKYLKSLKKRKCIEKLILTQR
ncbi:MAG: endonuclease [Candidatus Berkelbacteria bacterium]|nr:endonuclease [Candidatus Berkelbacteria bacterium]